MKKLIIILLFSQFVYSQNLTYYTLNVGQGDAALLISKNGQAAMFDIGGTGSTTTQVIIDTLKSLKITNLKYLFVSHYDKDHIVGVVDILNSGITIDSVFDRGNTIAVPTTATYTNYVNAISNKRKAIKVNDNFKFDNISITCICANGQTINSSYTTTDENTLSVGFIISVDNFKLYNAGDIDSPVEDNLEYNFDAIKISHHGSRTATSSNFLNKISPKVAFISCGSNQTYKHPHQEVVERLGANSNIKYIYQTQLGSGSYSDKVKVIGTIKTSVYNNFFIVNLDTFQLASTKVNNNTINNYYLNQNYPNPFNPSTKIEYSISEKTKVKIIIYDILGKEIKVLVNGIKNIGNYSESLNLANYTSGVYFYKLQTDKFSTTKKMLFIK